MEKLKLASSSFSERLRTSGTQMGRMVSTKMKEILQAPTPESKMVDEATLESMEEPNWGMNLRICAMINREEFSGTEIVKAIKKKVLNKSPVSQRLSLDLLETCSSNCEKVFSEIASEKLLDDMVKMVQDPKTDHGNRLKALQLIRAWGESEDLMYLPVFRQTYLFMKTSGIPAGSQEGNFPHGEHTLESYVNQQPISPPGSYPMPEMDSQGAENTTYAFGHGGRSVEENKEFLLVTRNSLDLLSNILNSGVEPIPIKDELTVSMVDKCKQALPAIQRIAENTTDDDVMLFEALSLHDELQQVISRCDEIEGALASGGELTQITNDPELDMGSHTETEKADSSQVESTKSSNTVEAAVTSKEGKESTETSSEIKEAVTHKQLKPDESGDEAKDVVAFKEESVEQRQHS